MEVDEKPTDSYDSLGGLDKQIKELIEAVVMPMTRKEDFDALGIKPPKGFIYFFSSRYSLFCSTFFLSLFWI